MSAPRTMLDKVWDAHCVLDETDERPAVLYVDLHLLHEVTSPQAFAALAANGLPVRRPERCLGTLDHSTPTSRPDPDGSWPDLPDAAARQIDALRRNCREHGIALCDLGSGRRGVVHVIGPELGRTRPGATIVCGDSHTSTHGAFGALAFGIGSTEVAHVLATQCLLQRRPRAMLVEVDGELGCGVTAKDLALAVCATLGPGGGAGFALEFRGPAIVALGMEGRMTLCNMAIEAGARTGMIAPDEITATWLRERLPGAGRQALDEEAASWPELHSDQGAEFGAACRVDAGSLAPTVTWGTNPAMTTPVDATVREPRDSTESDAQHYMGLRPGQAIAEVPVHTVFIGSCTNGRLTDLRAAASLLRGRRIAPDLRMLVVPGSDLVRAAAEAEGLDGVFRDAGAEWREPGCSMCIAMNGDHAVAGECVVSTSNRNFRGRQGPGARTILASPLTAAASALAGHVADPRPLLREPPHA